MIAFIQRALSASVAVAGETVGEIGPGLLILLGVEKGDTPAHAEKLAGKVLSYRIFPESPPQVKSKVH